MQFEDVGFAAVARPPRFDLDFDAPGSERRGAAADAEAGPGAPARPGGLVLI